MKFDNKEDILQLTPKWKGDRFDNGRPRVPDDILKRIESITTEEAWGVLWGEGYKHQFQDGWKVVPADKTLVGRAVTGVLVPQRPDVHDALLEYGHEKEGRIGFFNSWVIEILQEDDVMVIDMFDKIFQGTYVGGNLANTIAARTKRGQVLWCGVRDLEQIAEIDNLVTFYRGNDPTGIGDVTLTGINVPCRIGKAICMPGDVVLGTMSGVLFIPPHLAEECVVRAERTQLRELFGFQRIHEGAYTSAQMDTKWTDEIDADFADWRKTNTPEEYQHLEWEEDKSEGDQTSSEEADTLL